MLIKSYTYARQTCVYHFMQGYGWPIPTHTKHNYSLEMFCVGGEFVGLLIFIFGIVALRHKKIIQPNLIGLTIQIGHSFFCPTNL